MSCNSYPHHRFASCHVSRPVAAQAARSSSPGSAQLELEGSAAAGDRKQTVHDGLLDHHEIRLLAFGLLIQRKPWLFMRTVTIKETRLGSIWYKLTNQQSAKCFFVFPPWNCCGRFRSFAERVTKKSPEQDDEPFHIATCSGSDPGMPLNQPSFGP